ncbi:hypothetical protein ACXR0M_16825 [Pseudomonas sp. Eth.TT006]
MLAKAFSAAPHDLKAHKIRYSNRSIRTRLTRFKNFATAADWG